MAYTMQAVLDEARVPLNDAKKGSPADGVRWKESELLGHARHALHVTRRDRPDLWIGRFSFNIAGIAAGDAFPLPDEYASAIADYVTARAMTKDGEDVTDAKAPVFFALFGLAKGNQ